MRTISTPDSQDKQIFAEASKGWLKAWIGDPRLTNGDARIITAVYLGFNKKHYDKTGELLSWPGWLTLEDETAISQRSIARAFTKFERLGALKILRRGFDRKTGKRLPNKYLALPLTDAAHLTLESPGHLTPESGGSHLPNLASPPDSGVQSHLPNPPDSGVIRLCEGLGDSDSVNNRLSESSGSLATAPPTAALARPKEEEEEESKGNEAKQVRQPPPSSISSFLPSLSPIAARPPSLMQERKEAEATLERYRALAENRNGGGLTAGSSDDVTNAMRWRQ